MGVSSKTLSLDRTIAAHRNQCTFKGGKRKQEKSQGAEAVTRGSVDQTLVKKNPPSVRLSRRRLSQSAFEHRQASIRYKQHQDGHVIKLVNWDDDDDLHQLTQHAPLLKFLDTYLERRICWNMHISHHPRIDTALHVCFQGRC